MASKHLNQFGEHERLQAGIWRVDRLGLVTGQVLLHVQGEEPAGVDFALLNTRNAPASIGTMRIGIPCVSVERSYEPGKGIYTYAYEGQTQEFQFDDDHITFELDFSMSQEPIESHPNFAAVIKDKYGWNKLRRQFAEFMPGTGGTSGGGFGGASTAKKKKNDLYGTDSYLEVGAIFRKTYLRRSIPSNVLRGLGAIVSSPPGLGQFPMDVGPNRNWLKLAPKISRRGNLVQISEEWMLSGPRGWNKDVYNRSALEKGLSEG